MDKIAQSEAWNPALKVGWPSAARYGGSGPTSLSYRLYHRMRSNGLSNNLPKTCRQTGPLFDEPSSRPLLDDAFIAIFRRWHCRSLFCLYRSLVRSLLGLGEFQGQIRRTLRRDFCRTRLVWPEFVRSWGLWRPTLIGTRLILRDRIWPNLGRIWPGFDWFRPILARFQPRLVRRRPTSLDLSRLFA